MNYVYSTVHLFNKYLLSVSYVSGKDITVRKIDRAPALRADLLFYSEETENKLASQ